MSFLFRSLPGCVTSVRACCWAQGRRKARPGGRVLRVSPLLMDRFPLFLCSHLWPEVSSVCHIVGLGHVPQTARLSVGAASAAPHPCPARGWSGLLGLRSRIKGVFPPLGCFLGWSCLPGPPSWEPASLEQTETDRCPCQVLRNAANKKQSGMSLSCLIYSENLQASQNTWKSNIVPSCFLKKKNGFKNKKPIEKT